MCLACVDEREEECLVGVGGWGKERRQRQRWKGEGEGKRDNLVWSEDMVTIGDTLNVSKSLVISEKNCNKHKNITFILLISHFTPKWQAESKGILWLEIAALHVINFQSSCLP